MRPRAERQAHCRPYSPLELRGRRRRWRSPSSVPLNGQDALDLSDPLVTEELARARNEPIDDHSEVPHVRRSLASELRRDKLPDDLLVSPRSLSRSLDPEGLQLVGAHLEDAGGIDRPTYMQALPEWAGQGSNLRPWLVAVPHFATRGERAARQRTAHSVVRRALRVQDQIHSHLVWSLERAEVDAYITSCRCVGAGASDERQCARRSLDKRE